MRSSKRIKINASALKLDVDNRISLQYTLQLTLQYSNYFDMLSSIIDMLDIIIEDSITSKQRGEVELLLDLLQYFGFVFNLHLMRNILEVLNELSQALQKRDQDIVNAMKLV